MGATLRQALYLLSPQGVETSGCSVSERLISYPVFTVSGDMYRTHSLALPYADLELGASYSSTSL
jgi:hypothetical protein